MGTVCLSQTKTKTPVKLSAKDGITKVLDKMYLAYNTKDIKTFLSIMTEDGLFCGTDPTNIWTKATYAKNMTEMFADKSFSPNITVDKREISIDKNEKSAIVVDQFFFEWNKQIPVRHVTHFIKVGDNWKCDFLSTTFVPNDADLDKIFNALKK